MLSLSSKKKEISEIVLLVHPLHKPLFKLKNQHYLGKLISYAIKGMSKELKIESRLLLGAWGNQIRKAASNPNAIVVIVLPIIFPEIKSDWVRSRLRRLVDFAKREFGDRAFTFVGTIDPKELRFQIKKRGFVFDRGIFGSRFHGKSFGQYLELCVKEETELMAKAARVPKRSIKMVPELSLEYEKKRKKPKSLRIRRR